MVLNRHKSQKKIASLMLNTTDGCLTNEMKNVCAKFEKEIGMRVCVQERAGISNKYLAKSEPLRRKECGRLECFIYLSSGGRCEENEVGYEIKCEDCERKKQESSL